MTNEPTTQEKANEHTPGLWYYGKGLGEPILYTAGFDSIGPGNVPLPLTLPNLRLITAAPELLEAVEAAEDYFAIMLEIVDNTCEEHRGEMVKTRTLKGKTLDELFAIYKSKAQAAIKKAKGN